MSNPPSITPDLPTLFALLERLPVGVVLLDHDGRVLLYNAAEESIARRRREDILGRLFFQDVAPCIRDAGVGDEFFGRVGREQFNIEREVSFAFPFRDSPRQVKVKLVSLDVGGRPYGCLFIEDITAQRALDRLKDNLSALLVHDLKNPLAAVLANLDMLDLQPSAPADPTATTPRGPRRGACSAWWGACSRSRDWKTVRSRFGFCASISACSRTLR